MKKLLITGAKGFVGRHCLLPAIASGYEIHAITSNPNIDASLKIEGVNWHVANLLEYGAIEGLIGTLRPSHMIHTAWETSHGSYWTDPKNLDWLNLGTRIVKAFAQNGGERIVSAGTCAEYDWSHGYMVEGVTPENPATFYGQMKLAHHNLLQSSAQQLGFSAATGRIFFGFGAYENPNRIIPYACRSFINGEYAKFSSGTQYRDFMEVSDIGTGFIALLNSDLRGACNISSGVTSRLGDIVTMLGKISGRPELIGLGEIQDRPNDPKMIVGDNSKLLSTGWRPSLSLEEGLNKTMNWFNSRTL